MTVPKSTSGSRSSRDNCKKCGDPLGNSADGRCHDCGGETYRAGSRITGKQWKIMLGAY